ncbi:MAG: potassium-transporting ATPase subunit C [Pirellula sp.]|jgi:K+-transporting ATPase ATPase C chain|nr:potassium-transporting ATPase subunit C [Pirellula sp.]
MYYELNRSIRLTVLTVFACVVCYTILIIASAEIISPEGRKGSLIVDGEGRVRGSQLIAQGFSRPEYLWPRPSAVDYNATGASGSNLSPTNPKIRERAHGILDQYSLENGISLPAELATASGSGLDPHITLDAALIQLPRIATNRRIDLSKIQDLLRGFMNHNTRSMFHSGDLVNVLEFNLMLDTQVKSIDDL